MEPEQLAEATLAELGGLKVAPPPSAPDVPEPAWGLVQRTPLAGYHYQKYPNQKYPKIRRAKLILFLSVLDRYQAFAVLPRSEKYAIAEACERACHTHAVVKARELGVLPSWSIQMFADIYHIYAGKTLANLDPAGLGYEGSSAPTLGQQVVEGKLSPKLLPKIKARDVRPDMYVEIEHRAAMALGATASTKKTTTMQTCGKCGKKECTFVKVFSRSLDEDTPLRYTCVHCDHSWKG
jgi:DNA-directed RNA polymerase subunit M/transcription elongation factor TFIIS